MVVKSTTADNKPVIDPLFNADKIVELQQLIRRIPVADNVIEYAVKLVGKTRPKAWDIVFTIRVLASPGTPISKA